MAEGRVGLEDTGKEEEQESTVPASLDKPPIVSVRE